MDEKNVNTPDEEVPPTDMEHFEVTPEPELAPADDSITAAGLAEADIESAIPDEPITDDSADEDPTDELEMGELEGALDMSAGEAETDFIVQGASSMPDVEPGPLATPTEDEPDQPESASAPSPATRRGRGKRRSAASNDAATDSTAPQKDAPAQAEPSNQVDDAGFSTQRPHVTAERRRQAYAANTKAAEDRFLRQKREQARLDFQAQWDRVTALHRTNRTATGTLTAVVPMRTADNRTVVCAVVTINESALDGHGQPLVAHIPQQFYFYPRISLGDESAYMANTKLVMRMSESEKIQWLATRFLAGRIGEEVQFRITDMVRRRSDDSNIDHYMITGDRAIVQQRLVHTNFEGIDRRINEGDLVECRVVGVSSHRVRLDVGGLERRVERRFLSLRYIDDARKAFRPGDRIMCQVRSIVCDDNGRCTNVVVDPRYMEMRDILAQNRFNTVMSNSYANATITSRYIDPNTKILTYLLWIEGLNLPGRANRVAIPSTLNVKNLEPGTVVQVRILYNYMPEDDPQRTRVNCEIRKILD